MFHEKIKGAKCDICGYDLKRDFAVIPVCGRCNALERRGCVYRGEPTGLNELIRCQTCEGNVRVKFPIHTCAIHETCLPTYNGTDAERMTCTKCRAESLGFESKEPNP